MPTFAGISAGSVRRIWRARGLAPHRMRSFKLSKDQNFAVKLRDVVGLYVDPPAHAVVLSVDEKSQIHALDGTIIGRSMQRHRHQELIRFLNAVEAEVRPGKVVHVILDNYGAHRHPKVRA